ncbi:alpha-L-fucosidase [Edaphobacter modestus]|uniref:alpha-L-fucosidase n=1 Tax=Edaphobacter modestus TaxID=388466 RepID=A0A4Q7YSL3_9BACT|nr:alpha-L-fucosidase [Edaphobacter modestus]RZU40540.1 alpha-L-fucosidase [Edaphobacter modestus]
MVRNGLRNCLIAVACGVAALHAAAQGKPIAGENTDFTSSLNKADRVDWFRDQGFGLFIHWGVDSQLGVTISHSLVGASPEYTERFFNELPKTFDPVRFDPGEWARLARLAGVRYVVFTAKHHSGFGMYATATTPFNVMNTPFHRDITAEVLKAFREQGIAPGLYFSPDDFYWLHKNGKAIQRGVDGVQPSHNPGLLEYDSAQLRELLTHYGPVDVLFFDGEATSLRQLAWKLQPEILVTRGAMLTPEQTIPGMPFDGPWESCITMGDAWQYQPQNDHYKSGRELIQLLIETRAKGGNLLLNVGPKPNGELAIEQEERLREIALWMFVNSEAIYSVRPWIITNEGDVWFTKKKDSSALYAIVDPATPWKMGEWKDLVLHSVKATAKTEVSVLGANGEVLEYAPKVTPKTTFHMESDGLHLRTMRSQRMQDNKQWPNPIVVRMTNVEPALVPPRVQTGNYRWDGSSGSYRLEGELLDMGGAKSLAVGFEYRSIEGEDVHARTAPWVALPLQTVTQAGIFSAQLVGMPATERYEFRAVVRHPLLALYGAEKTMRQSQ